jgi:hypothetical protein
MMDEAGQKSGEVELRHYSTCPVLAGQAQSAEVTLQSTAKALYFEPHRATSVNHSSDKTTVPPSNDTLFQNNRY